MDGPGERENPFHTLYMRQLSLNLDVLSSILNHLGVLGRAWTILTPDLRLRVLEEEELSIVPDHRVSTNEGEMARTPYVTVRGAEPVPPPSPAKETTMPEQYKKPEDEEDRPPEAEAEEPKEVKLDAEEINELLDVVHNTADLPSLLALNQAAMINLSIKAAEVQEELDKRAEEMKKKAEEFQAKVAEWKAKKEKERKKEELEAKEKAEKAEKEKLYA